MGANFSNFSSNNDTVCSRSLLNRGLLQSTAALCLFSVAFGLVIAGSLIGNGSVIGLLVFKRNMRTATNLLIASLASADLLVTVFLLWANPLSYWRRSWEFGRVPCFLSYLLGGASLLWSPYTITAMAIDRYLAVNKPLRGRMSPLRCMLAVLAIWSLALVLLIPPALHLQFLEIDQCHTFCIEVWTDPGRLVYGCTILALRTLLPFTIIATCHGSVVKSLRQRDSRMQQQQQQRQSLQLSERERARNEQREHLEHVLLIMVLVFGVCTFPLDLFNILQDIRLGHDQPMISPDMAPLVYLSCYWLAMLGTVCNPLIYGWANENFKRQVQQTVTGLGRRLSESAHNLFVRSVNRASSGSAKRSLSLSRKRRLPSMNEPSERDSLMNRSRASLNTSGNKIGQTRLYSYNSTNQIDAVAQKRSHELMPLREIDHSDHDVIEQASANQNPASDTIRKQTDDELL